MQKSCFFTGLLVLLQVLLTAFALWFFVDKGFFGIERLVLVLLILLAGLSFLVCGNCLQTKVVFISLFGVGLINGLFLALESSGSAQGIFIFQGVAAVLGFFSLCSCSKKNESEYCASSCACPPSVEVYHASKEKPNADQAFVELDDLKKYAETPATTVQKKTARKVKIARKVSQTAPHKKNEKNKKHKKQDLVL